MNAGIAISLVVLAVVLIGTFTAYRRAMRRLALDETVREIKGVRLTSERLHALPSPPWRIVPEIGHDRLGGVDHVVIGPAGIFAIETIVAERPGEGSTTDPYLVAAAATMRAPADELAQRVGLRCDLLAKVFWGSQQPERPAAFPSVHATVAVEGQRLTEWLSTLPPRPLTGAQIDLAWQAILTGIGRPDPLADG